MELGRPKEETAKSPSKEIPGLSPDRLVTSEAKERAKAEVASNAEKIDPNKLIEPKTRAETEYRDDNGGPLSHWQGASSQRRVSPGWLRLLHRFKR